VSSIFSSAIFVSGEKIINDFLLEQKNTYIDLINSWIERLETQIELISVLSTFQKTNADLIVRILNSVKNYDEELYLQISDHVYSQIQRLSSYSAKTQEKLNAVNDQLDEIKQFIDSSLSSKLNRLTSEINELRRLIQNSSTEEEGDCQIFKCFVAYCIISVTLYTISPNYSGLAPGICLGYSVVRFVLHIRSKDDKIERCSQLELHCDELRHDLRLLSEEFLSFSRRREILKAVLHKPNNSCERFQN
jgi:hypothetical protein